VESCSCRQCVEGEVRRALRIFKSQSKSGPPAEDRWCVV
jgi:hypothetical protein